jgi:hypothetical protein
MMKAAGFSFVVGTTLLGACGGGSSAPEADAAPEIDATPVIDAAPPTPDAGPFCVGFDLPQTADDPIAVAGGVYTINLDGATPVGGANLVVFDDEGNEVASATSVADGPTVGDFLFGVPTGGVPVNGFIEAEAETYRPTRVFPPTPLRADLDNVAVLMLTPENFGLLNNVLLQESQDPELGWVGVAVLDAGGSPIAGVTVSSVPAAGAVHYNEDEFPNSGATETDADGVAYLVNVPVGPLTVYVDGAPTEMRPTTIDVVAGLTTTVGVVPCSAGAE